MKRALFLTLGSVVVAGSLLGCNLLKKKGAADGGADAALEAGETAATVGDAATVTVSGTGAKNEANVLRYAEETAIANEPAVIGKDGTVARNFPGNGPEVATLAKGTAVAKIAQYFSTATLVMFDDASGDGSKLIGWVVPTAFDTAAPPPAKPVVVPPRVVGDAGAHPADGGARPADAGIAADAGAKRDAGAAAPAPPAGAASATPVGGTCPWDGWAIVGATCRHRCLSDSDCSKPLKCQVKPGKGKFCSP